MKGIDISSNNHAQGEVFNWLHVKEDGYEVVWIKATQGIHYLNPYLVGDVRDAFNNGLKVGLYHFYDSASGTPDEQAKWFLRNGIEQPEENGRTVGDFCELMPVLDYETLNTVEERDIFLKTLGRPCALYTDRSIEQAIGYGAAKFGWLAWPGWTNEELPAGTAVVQTGQQQVHGIPTMCDIDIVVDASVISANTVIQPPTITERETEMTQYESGGQTHIVVYQADKNRTVHYWQPLPGTAPVDAPADFYDWRSEVLPEPV